MHHMVHFLFLAVSLFAVGACLGSFSGVLMESRVKRSFWTGRSQCLSCYTQLSWYEMIPLVSYIIQRGKCRQCSARIPLWVFSIEMMTGILWMLFGTVIIIKWFSLWVVISHLILLTMILILAIEDIKNFTIPDRLSLPMILITVIFISFSWGLYEEGLLPGIWYSIIGGAMGMMFYLLQMMVPGIFSLIRKKNYRDSIHIFFLPLFFPFWLMIKFFFWEKTADTLIPSLWIMDKLPTWVGGGDVRLGILLGLILGPVYFWWTIGIGYTIWTIFWLVSRTISKKHLDILPVAPLLFLWFCATWLILLFS